MPLFKYGATEPVGEILINGSITFPLLQVAGVFIITVESDITLPAISVQGFFGVEGNVNLPLVRVYGKMQDELNGEVTIPLIRVDSEILGSSAIAGDVFLPGLYVSGDMQAECSITIPALRVIGTLQSQGVMTGAVTIPRVQVFGKIEQIQCLTGNVILPVISVSGTISPSLARTIDGAAGLPVLRVVGIIFNSTYSFSEDDAVLRYDASRRLI